MEENKIKTVIVKYSLLYGIASFIPLPFVDDYAQEVLFRRMLNKIFNYYERPLSHLNAKRLSQKSGGCCWGCIMGVFLWPIKKIIKTVAFFLSFKSLSDEIASCSIRAIAYQEALKLGFNDEEEEKILLLKQEVEKLAQTESTSVMNVLFAILESSKRGIRTLIWGLLRRIRSETEEEIDPAIIKPLYDALFSSETRQENIRTKLAQALSLPLPQIESKELEDKAQNLSQINEENEDD